MNGVGFCVVEGLTRTTTADDEGIHITAVRSHVVPDTEVLCQYLVVLLGFLVVLLVQLLHVSPLCRAELLTSAVVGLGIVIDQQDKTVYDREDQNTRQ